MQFDIVHSEQVLSVILPSDSEYFKLYSHKSVLADSKLCLFNIVKVFLKTKQNKKTKTKQKQTQQQQQQQHWNS